MFIFPAVEQAERMVPQHVFDSAVLLPMETQTWGGPGPESEDGHRLVALESGTTEKGQLNLLKIFIAHVQSALGSDKLTKKEHYLK